MSGRKKKLSAKLKQYNVLLIISLVVLMCLLGVLMVVKMFKTEVYYKTEDRQENIAKSKLLDNSDHETIGWLRVQGTNIDYPVYGVLSQEYEAPVVSQTFTWSLNDDSLFHNTMIVYGHNVMNLGPKPSLHEDTFIRMEELMGFVYYDFAKENQYIQLTMNGEDYLYKIFSVRFSTLMDLNKYPSGEFDYETRKDYLDFVNKESIYDYDVSVKEDDKLLSVVTCSRFFGYGENYDFIVTGRLVRPGEKVEQYSVYRNRNYEKIDTILKGAGENEIDEEN